MSDRIDELLSKKIRVPNMNDQLFVDVDNWPMTARLDLYLNQSELYVAGYKEAADALIETVSVGKGTADSLVFPIIFLYRHYLELRLKSLLEEGRHLLGVDHKAKNEHDLFKLWSEVRSILEDIWPNGDQSDFDAINTLIVQFKQIDPRSTAFRYPNDMDGTRSVSLDVPRINLSNLSEVVGAMSSVLEGAAGAISEYQQN
jgi:hypothetical protein